MPSLPKPKLMVVEDDPGNLELMTELLQQLEAEVRPIADSQEAAACIKQQKFDGIFLDIGMPILSGFDLAKLVRESSFNKTTPIVIVTGRQEQDVMHSSFSVGATYFLHKPVDKVKLFSLLEKVKEPFPENRRRHTRVPLNTEVSCTRGDQTMRGVTWNISQGGIQLEIKGLKQGDTITMSFVLPHPKKLIKAEGVVAWEREERQGLYFTSMGLTEQALVRDYITKTAE